MKKLSGILIEQLKKALASGSREELTCCMYRATSLLIMNKSELVSARGHFGLVELCL